MALEIVAGMFHLFTQRVSGTAKCKSIDRVDQCLFIGSGHIPNRFQLKAATRAILRCAKADSLGIVDQIGQCRVGYTNFRLGSSTGGWRANGIIEIIALKKADRGTADRSSPVADGLSAVCAVASVTSLMLAA